MKKIVLYTASLLLFSLTACSRFLDEKSDQKLTTPVTLEDNQALLDRISDVLTNFALSGMASSDDYYISDADYNALNYEEDKRLYTWQPNYVSTNQSNGNDWQYCYKAIFITNAVIYNLDNYNIPDAGNVRGQALVIRAARYFDAAQTWCLAYSPATADQNLGLPLRLDPDMNIPSVRATLKETYSLIIKDLKEAIPLLPVEQVAVSRPSKVAALAYLARVYLAMGDEQNALAYALQALTYKNALMNFNILKVTDSYPIKDLNTEVILRASMRTSGPTKGTFAKVPLNIYESYDSNDLRKSIFFRVNPDQSIIFRGNYTGNISGKLSGVAVDEVYLMIAECYARLDNKITAMNYLNDLLVTRWRTDTFVPLTATSSDEALQIILAERRKELLFRGLRWMDLKRYNRDGANIKLTRTILGQTFTLQPNDLRCAIAIPEDIIKISGIPQNPR